MDDLFSPTKAKANNDSNNEADANILINHLTSVWGAEPRPGEATYTVGKTGKRMMKRPSIQALRLPFGTPTSKRSISATLAPLTEMEEARAEQSKSLEASMAATPRGRGGSSITIDVGESDSTDSQGACACLIPKPVKFGMWDGVFARCLLNIFGVIMFLRVPWLVAFAGFWETILIMAISVGITTITSLSLSAICTNGEVKGGGAYYLISRALGAEFGGAIGIMFYIGNAVGVAMYHIGFAETVVSLLGGNGMTLMVEGWDQKIIALIALAAVQLVCVTSIALVVKVQLGLLAVLVVALILFVIGCFTPHPDLQGYAGVGGPHFQQNLYNDYSRSQVYQIPNGTSSAFSGCPHPLDPTNKPGNWTSDALLEDLDGTVSFGVALGIFFPAVTGIMAGANISGDLKDPSKAIPFGTNLSIAVSTVVYFILAFLVALVTYRSVPGIYVGENCPYGGSFHDYLIMARISLWPPMVYAGIFGATISSGIASLVGAPRILQAVAADGIFPYMGFLAKTFGPNKEPVAGYLFTCAIAIFCIIALDLNAVAPLITNFFMCSYALTNFACFMADMSKSPGWRPTFTYYNKWLSLMGAIICVAFMMYLNYVMGFFSIVCGAGLYMLVWYLEPDVNWGSASEGYKYIQAHQAVLTLAKTKDHVKNFRPSPLILIPFDMEEEEEQFDVDAGAGMGGASGSSDGAEVGDVELSMMSMAPQKDMTTSLLLLAKDLKKGHGLLVIGHVMMDDETSSSGAPPPVLPVKTVAFPTSPSNMEDEHNQAESKTETSPLRGINQEIQNGTVALSAVVPLDDSSEQNNSNAQVIKMERRSSFSHDQQRLPFENQYLLKSKCQKQIQQHMTAQGVTGFANVVRARSYYSGATALMQVSGLGKLTTNTLVVPFPEDWFTRKNHLNAGFVGMLGDAFDNGYGVCILRSSGKDYAAARDLAAAPIDVWWNADDGGLTLLLPHLIGKSQAWRRHKSPMRVMSSLRPEDLGQSAAEIARIQNLVDKFRIGKHRFFFVGTNGFNCSYFLMLFLFSIL
jgi:amino acid transporter